MEAYTYGFSSLAGRAMFGRAGPSQYDDQWAAFAKDIGPHSDELAAAIERNLLSGKNLCAADETDDGCFDELDQALTSGLNFLHDDFPAPVPERDYWLDMPDGTPARCNPVTAPPECTSEALESL